MSFLRVAPEGAYAIFKSSPRGSIFVSLRVAPEGIYFFHLRVAHIMIENNFNGHYKG